MQSDLCTHSDLFWQSMLNPGRRPHCRHLQHLRREGEQLPDLRQTGGLGGGKVTLQGRGEGRGEGRGGERGGEGRGGEERGGEGRGEEGRGEEGRGGEERGGEGRRGEGRGGEGRGGKGRM